MVSPCGLVVGLIYREELERIREAVSSILEDDGVYWDEIVIYKSLKIRKAVGEWDSRKVEGDRGKLKNGDRWKMVMGRKMRDRRWEKELKFKWIFYYVFDFLIFFIFLA